MALVRSLIFKILRSHGYYSYTQGSVGVRSIELFSQGERLLIPGYPFGGLQPAGSEVFDDAPEIAGGIFKTAEAATSNPVWYKWTAPKSGTMLLNFETEQYSIDVYIGDTEGSLVAVPLGIDNTANIRFNAVAGQEYKIRSSNGSSSLRGALVEVYTSVAPRDYNYDDGYYWDGRGAFLDQNPWDTQTSYSNNNRASLWLSEINVCNDDGYVVDGDYIQLVMVLPFTVECDQIGIYNYYYTDLPFKITAFGVREVQVYYSESEISQADAEDDSVPVPGEILFNTATDVERYGNPFFVEEYIPSVLSAGLGLGFTASAEYPFTKIDAGIGLGFAASGGYNASEVDLKASIGLGFNASGASKENTLTCGLALAASMSAQHTSLPTQLLANLGLGMSAKAEQSGQTVKCKAGICIECLLKAERIPDKILKAGIGLGVQMEARQKYNSSVSGTIYLGCKMSAEIIGPPPCLAQEFQHFKWF